VRPGRLSRSGSIFDNSVAVEGERERCAFAVAASVRGRSGTGSFRATLAGADWSERGASVPGSFEVRSSPRGRGKSAEVLDDRDDSDSVLVEAGVGVLWIGIDLGFDAGIKVF
jgi:hypothetical protein